MTRPTVATGTLAFAVSLLLAASTPAGEIIFEQGIEYSNPDDQHLQLNLAQPKERNGLLPAVVCIHGGGFRAGNRDRWNKLCEQLAERGYVAVTVSYRLAPKYQFPAALHDVKAAVRWLHGNWEKYGIDRARIGAVGDSAGGTLAQLLGVTGGVRFLEGAEAGDAYADQSSFVRCVVNYYGASDFTKSYDKSVDAAQVLPLFLGGDLEHARHRHILASPLYWVTPVASPTLLLHGTKDPYVAFEQATLFYDRMKAAMVDVQLVELKDAGHGFKGADAERAEHALFKFFDQQLAKAAADQ
jgi:acetyl esterase/lipase